MDCADCGQTATRTLPWRATSWIARRVVALCASRHLSTGPRRRRISPGAALATFESERGLQSACSSVAPDRTTLHELLVSALLAAADQVFAAVRVRERRPRPERQNATRGARCSTSWRSER
jgi:hypothetical protein